ncbi:hypothetical protein ACFU6I_31400 [Streptomyces sp. NPDC057486]|uniref:hypothetical protein n=1 Tax=Streptomyces sp. NPDC057486 TaxID=3346145 RepID=UPI0036C742C6
MAWTTDKGGRREQAATWSCTPNGSARLTGASSISRDRVALTTARNHPAGDAALIALHIDARLVNQSAVRGVHRTGTTH